MLLRISIACRNRIFLLSLMPPAAHTQGVIRRQCARGVSASVEHPERDIDRQERMHPLVTPSSFHQSPTATNNTPHDNYVCAHDKRARLVRFYATDSLFCRCNTHDDTCC